MKLSKTVYGFNGGLRSNFNVHTTHRGDKLLFMANLLEIFCSIPLYHF